MRRTAACILAACILASISIMPALADNARQQTMVNVTFTENDPVDKVRPVTVPLSISDEEKQRIESLLYDFPQGIPCAAISAATNAVVAGITCEPLRSANINSNESTINVSRSCDTSIEFKLILDIGGEPGEEPQAIGEYLLRITDDAHVRVKDNKAITVQAGNVEPLTLLFPQKTFAGNSYKLTLTNGFFDTWTETALPSYIESFTIGGHTYTGKLPSANDNKPPKDNEATVAFRASAAIAASAEPFELTLPIYVPISLKGEDDVTLNAHKTGDSAYDHSLTVANIQNPFNVSFNQSIVRVGLQSQKAEELSIQETDKGIFRTGEVIIASFSSEGIFWASKPDISSSQSNSIDDTLLSVNKESIRIKLDRASKAANNIVIGNPFITVDRTVPLGTANLLLSGSSIDLRGGVYVCKDYLSIASSAAGSSMFDFTQTGSFPISGASGTILFSIFGNAEQPGTAQSLITEPILPMSEAYNQIRNLGNGSGNVCFASNINLAGVHGYTNLKASLDFSNAGINTDGVQLIHLSYQGKGYSEIFTYNAGSKKWTDANGNESSDVPLKGLSPFMLLYNAKTPSAPQTGDGTSPALLLALLALSGGTACLLGIGRKRRGLNNTRRDEN